jgi:hypothetical protein
MAYTDSKGNVLEEGLYRDNKDKSYVIYLFMRDGKWKFESPDSSDVYDFPLNLSKEIEKVEFLSEIERFRKILNFLEKGLYEEIERRR